MKNHIFFIALFISLLFSFRISAEIRILSPYRSRDVTYNWDCENNGLSHTKTEYGDVYYNPNWQDMSKPTSITTLPVISYFDLRTYNTKSWQFYLPIANLNVEKGHLYSDSNFPDKKQSAEQIYWGISIGYYTEDDKFLETTIWIHICSSVNPYISFIYYMEGDKCATNSSWKRSEKRYPEVTVYNPKFPCYFHPHFVINVWGGHADLSWGSLNITRLPFYIRELTYIVVHIGTQAKI